MENKFLFTLLLLICLGQEALQRSTKARTKLSLYYDSYCPYSVEFLRDQLQPLMKSTLGQYVNLELNPYGTSYTLQKNGKVEFACSRGEKECYKDKLHSCALKMYAQSKALDYIVCSSVNRRVMEGDQNCSSEFKLDFERLTSCAMGELGTKYLDEYGKVANALKPALERVPLVIYNDKYSQDKWYDSLDKVRPVVCEEIGEALCKREEEEEESKN